METIALITVLGIVITVLVAILGWLVVRGYAARDKKEDRLVEVTDKLLVSQHNLDTTVVKLSENIMAQIDICRLKHNPIDTELKNHSNLLSEHNKQLNIIEKKLTKINNT